jgi:hypothetical protein
MAIKITGIPNAGVITVEGAASEATLQQLLTAMDKSKAASAPGSDPAGAVGAEGTKAVQNVKKAGEMVGQAVSETAGLFNKAFTNTTPTIKDFSGILAKYTPTAAGSKVVETFGGVMADNVEIFRTLSTAGIDLGDSLLQAQLSAADARLPLDIFAKTIKENSNILSNAFGGATAGAAKFADMSGKVMATAGKDLAKLGFSMDEISSYSASYIEQLQRSGRAQSMSTSQLAEGAIKYNLELDKMAKATGISRQQLDEANKAAQRDTRMRLSLSQLGETERAAVTAKMEELKKLDPTGKYAAGMADLIAGGGVALTKEARMVTLAMSQSGVDMAKITRDISTGQKGAVDQMNAGFSRAAKEAQNMSEGSRRTTTALATMGVETPMYYKATLAGLGDSQQKINAATEEQAKKLASKDPTRAVAGLDQTLTEVQNSFKKSLIESKVLDATANAMSYAADKTKVLADTFADMTTTEKLASVFGVEFGKILAGTLATYLTGKGLVKYGEGVQGRADAKVEKAKIEAMEPKERERYLQEKEELNKIKAEKEAAEKAAKGSVGKQAINFLKGAGGKILALVTIGGVTYTAFHYDVAGQLVEGMAGSGTGEQPKPLSIDQQRERDKLTTPGAEISKASADTAAAPPATPAVADTTAVSKLNEDVTALKASLKEIDYSNLMFPDAVGTSIESGSIKLKNLSDSINVTTTAFKDLNNVSLEKLNDSITKLSDAMNKPTGTATTETTKVGAKTQEDLLTEMLGKLDQLNMSMANVADSQSSAVDYLSKTAKYTRQTSNNSA